MVQLDGTRAVAGEIRATLSSEAPVVRGSYLEILDHGPESIDLGRASGGLPLLASHQQAEIPPPGRVESIRLAGRKLRGVLRFSGSARGTELRAAVEEGFIGGLSVGYLVHETRRDGADPATGLPIIRAMRWELLEVSLVNVPADTDAGVGRALPEVKTQRRIEVMESQDLDVGALGREQRQRYSGIQSDTQEFLGQFCAMWPDHAAGIVRTASEQLARVLPDERRFTRPEAIGEIQGACRRFVSDAVRSSQSYAPGQPGSETLDARNEADYGHAGRGAGGGGFGLRGRDASRYSVRRAVETAIDVSSGRRRAYDGLEGEVHQELVRTRGAGAPDHGGMLIPWRTRTEEESMRLRTLGTMQPAGGAALVGQMVMPDMIDLLRNRAMVLAAGAKLYPGLQGVVQFNKATADPTVQWMAENPSADATASEPAFGYVTLSPKTLIGSVQFPRQLLAMSSIDIEADIRMRLAAGHALRIDAAALHGPGTDREPCGIYSAAGVQTFGVAGIPDLAHICRLPGMIAAANADLGALAYMVTPGLAEVMQRTPVVSGQAVFIWEGKLQNGLVRGYPGFSTNQMSKTLGAGLNEHGMIFGNWNDLAVGMWGNELEIVVDQVTLAARGQIKITSYSMADIAVLRGDSFVKGTGALIA
jgi:HK97 family phage major capsid protein